MPPSTILHIVFKCTIKYIYICPWMGSFISNRNVLLMPPVTIMFVIFFLLSVEYKIILIFVVSCNVTCILRLTKTSINWNVLIVYSKCKYSTVTISPLILWGQTRWCSGLFCSQTSLWRPIISRINLIL